MTNTIHRHTFPNGLTLLAERLDHVRSATMFLLIPAGYSNDPPDRLGTSTILAELITRGAGDYDSKTLSLAFDNLGADRSESVGMYNLILSAGMLARNLPKTPPNTPNTVLRPRLPDAELDPTRDLILQDLLGLEDSPQEKAILELKNRYYPEPLNRNRYGTEAGVKAITPATLRDHYTQRVRPHGAVLSAAGAIDWPQLRDQVERLFGDWTGQAEELKPPPNTPKTQSHHMQKATQQTQIALAFPSVPLGDPDFYAARGAVGVLSGGMSARLFTEVREKRGLCYSVYASHDTLKDRAAVIGYAGSRSDRAQQTLDVMVGEFRRLKEGIAADEIDRVRAALKTSLVMQQESTSARAATLASDWFHLGRVRSVEEVGAAVEALDPKSIMGYLERHPVRDLTVVTLGPEPLQIPE